MISTKYSLDTNINYCEEDKSLYYWYCRSVRFGYILHFMAWTHYHCILPSTSNFIKSAPPCSCHQRGLLQCWSKAAATAGKRGSTVVFLDIYTVYVCVCVCVSVSAQRRCTRKGLVNEWFPLMQSIMLVSKCEMLTAAFSLLPARSNLGSFMSGSIFSAKQGHWPPSPQYSPPWPLCVGF